MLKVVHAKNVPITALSVMISLLANNVQLDLKLRKSLLVINKFKLAFRYVETELDISLNAMMETLLMATDAVVLVMNNLTGLVLEVHLFKKAHATSLFLMQL